MKLQLVLGASLFALLFTSACKPEEDTGDTSDTSDTDDTDDTEEVVSYDHQYKSGTGTLTYSWIVGEDTVCDAEFSLSGSDYAGACEDCEFMFEMTNTVVSDDSTDDCERSHWQTFEADPNGDFVTKYFGGVSNFVRNEDYYGYPLDYNYTNALIYGGHFSVEYYGNTYSGEVFRALIFDSYELVFSGETYASESGNTDTDDEQYTLDGTSLDWSLNYNFDTNVWALSDLECEDVNVGADHDGSNTGATISGDVPCTDDTVVDIYSFEVAEGTEIAITVDTLSDDDSFEPWFAVTDPSGCFVDPQTHQYLNYEHTAYAEYECSFDSTEAAEGCPSYKIDSSDAGVYKVIVGSSGYGPACADEDTDSDPIGAYVLKVAAGDLSELTVVEDNTSSVIEIPNTVSVVGSMTLSE